LHNTSSFHNHGIGWII